MSGGLLVAGTTSDAGKSVLTAGICRWLHRRGVRVAPFKAQNMSNNSVVVLGPDGAGGEIGRAQAMQAAACGVAPDLRFNPVLLKPGSDLSSQVVLLGRAVDTVTAGGYRGLRPRLSEAAFAALAELRADYDAVVCEGAGSPAEINLRDGDFVNMGLARHAGLPAIVVGDIDRGGVFAALYGTVALLDRADQELVAGFVINKFRGDLGLLRPGLDMITEVTGRPVHGVLPYARDVWLDAEDSLAYGGTVGRPAPPRGREWLRVAVVRLPRISNATDAEALAAEPGVRVRLTTDPGELADADLVVLPGSKATVSDLTWLRATGLADAVVAHAAAGRPVLGICGGFQMLGTVIHDTVESGGGTVPGLGLLPVEVTFAARKTLARSAGTAYGDVPVHGYEIHHGVVTREAPHPLLHHADGRPEGGVAGAVSGTHWHGAFESDAFRRRFLAEAARQAGRHGFAVAPDTRYAAVRDRALDVLGDLVEEHLDTGALWRLIEGGPPRDLPFLPPGAPAPRPPATAAEPAPESAEPAPESVSEPAPEPVAVEPAAPEPVAGASGLPPTPAGAGRHVAHPPLSAHSPVLRAVATASALPGPATDGAPARIRESFAALAVRVRAAPPRLGRVRLVAVDGPSGAGKTSFTRRLARELGGAPVVHTDDLLDGWDDQFTFWNRLEESVLEPLAHGRTAVYHRYLWHRGRFGGTPRRVPPEGVVLLEGVSAARRAVRDRLSLAVFVTAPPDVRLARVLARDRGDVAFRRYFDRWRAAEGPHFAADRTAGHADVVVDGAAPDNDGHYVRVDGIEGDG